MRYGLEGQTLAVLCGAGSCTELHGRRFDAAYALLVQLIWCRTADEVLVALVDLGEHGSQSQAATGLSDVDDEQILEMIFASEVRLHCCMGEVLVRLFELGLARFIKDADFEGECHGVAEQHPAHAITAPARLQPAVNTLVTHALVHVRLWPFLVLQIIWENELIIIVTGREVQSARMPFGQQHQTFDCAECAQTFPGERIHV